MTKAHSYVTLQREVAFYGPRYILRWRYKYYRVQRHSKYVEYIVKQKAPREEDCSHPFLSFPSSLRSIGPVAVPSIGSASREQVCLCAAGEKNHYTSRAIAHALAQRGTFVYRTRSKDKEWKRKLFVGIYIHAHTHLEFQDEKVKIPSLHNHFFPHCGSVWWG